MITTIHSPARSPYWSTRRLLAAGFPLWPVAPLPRQPDPLGLPRGGHADADLSADASSTWFGCNQYSLPHIIPISDFPDAGLQKFATLPVRMIGENYLSELASMYNVYTYEEKSAMSRFEWLFSLCVKRERERLDYRICIRFPYTIPMEHQIICICCNWKTRSKQMKSICWNICINKIDDHIYVYIQIYFIISIWFEIYDHKTSLWECMYRKKEEEKIKRSRQDSNLQSPDPKSGALSIRPRDPYSGSKNFPVKVWNIQERHWLSHMAGSV